jgi:menaquinone-dependent protoporphyrinogen oxidase
MNMLVAYATKHGSTGDIAEAIAAEMQGVGHNVVIADVKQVESLAGYDGVILGSAVYAGHWLSEAKKLIEHHREELRALPVWLFSSGPLGAQKPPAPVDPKEEEWLLKSTGARAHRIFPGRLDPNELGHVERLVARIVNVSGDFRDWEVIRNWAREIAAELESIRSRAPGGTTRAA